MFIFRIIYAAYLGYALGQFANLHYYDWQFYAILVPTVLLVGLKDIIEYIQED